MYKKTYEGERECEYDCAFLIIRNMFVVVFAALCSDFIYTRIFRGSPKARLCVFFPGGSAPKKTMIGVNSSMRVFHLGPRRPRSGASSRVRSSPVTTRVAQDLGSTLVSFGRDLDATKRGRDVPR